VGFEHSAIDCRNCSEEAISRPMALNVLVNHPIPPRVGCFVNCAPD
jgi:hypothetical protein